MATHFKWYGSNTNVTVPMNAVYTYPSQANKTVKSTPRLPPRNGSDFRPGQEIKIEIPAMGYLNGGNTSLSFDVDLTYTPYLGDSSIIRFQNNIQSLFDRVSIMYGSTPIEDIQRYNQIVRSMTEWTTTGDFDQGSINDGIAHSTVGLSGLVLTTAGNLDDSRPLQKVQKVNVRQAYIHGISLQKAYAFDRQASLAGDGFGIVPYLPTENIPGGDDVVTTNPITVTRRYVVQLNLGMLLQGKLIPVKYMASQLSINIRTAPAADCIYWQQGVKFSSGYLGNYQANSQKWPSYLIRNVTLIPEILEFDSSYDQAVLDGLSSGIPLLFSSFNTFEFATSHSNVQTLHISERNRSIKSVFTLQKRSAADLTADFGATFYTTGITGMITAGDNNLNDVPSTLQEFQYRIGGRYFPASPVQCAVAGSHISNGGAEAYMELAKALNTVGDYRLSTPCNVLSWATPIGIAYNRVSAKTIIFPEYDGSYDVIGHLNNGIQLLVEVEHPATVGVTPTGYVAANYGGRSGAGMNSCCFAMATSLETSNGMEISGLNAEEQSDISITMRWSGNQSEGMQFIAFTYYDAMLVLFENNVVQLIK